MYFGALIEVVRNAAMRNINLHCEMQRASDRFLMKRGYLAEERPKKLEAVIKSIEAADRAIKAGARQIDDLEEARVATEADFERAANILLDSAYESSVQTGRAAAFLEMALQSTRDGRRNEATKSQLAERDAAILKRAEAFGKASADKIGSKLSLEFHLSSGTIARIVRTARNQEKNSRSQVTALKKTGPMKRSQVRVQDPDPT